MQHPRMTLALLFLVAAFAPSCAQPPAPTIPALFLSDIHLDPFADPAKVAKLNAAPASGWAAILAAPNSPTLAAEAADLQKTCPVRGTDTTNALWLSSLAAIHTSATHARFATISGDFLAHSFDCKFHTLLPKASEADYLAFTHKTVEYIVASLRHAIPGVPLYIGMGNNDSGCTDYALDAAHDHFLERLAPLVADSLPNDLPKSDRDQAQHDFAAGGYYNVPLAAVPHTRLVVLDDLFLAPKYVTCSGKPDAAPAEAQLAWLQSQLDTARAAHDRVWVMAHIPPGVNLYATARARLNICAGAAPQMFLGSEKLEEILAANADVVHLALFGHTHSDEFRLLTEDVSSRAKVPQSGAAVEGPAVSATGVPLKVVPSITPVNGNNPTFTLAQIDSAAANLADYTVVMASNQTGIATTWSPAYTYSTAYRQPAFDAASLSTLITGFASDPTAASPASQAYVNAYTPGTGLSTLVLQLAWPQYACSMTHDSAASFTACACATLK